MINQSTANRAMMLNMYRVCIEQRCVCTGAESASDRAVRFSEPVKPDLSERTSFRAVGWNYAAFMPSSTNLSNRWFLWSCLRLADVRLASAAYLACTMRGGWCVSAQLSQEVFMEDLVHFLLGLSPVSVVLSQNRTDELIIFLRTLFRIFRVPWPSWKKPPQAILWNYFYL